jgi:tetratricopeptide (TPR) repeat protein
LELNPKLDSAIEFRGLISFNMGDYKQAYEDLLYLAQKTEEYAIRYFDYAGRCLYHLGRYDVAIECLCQAIEIDTSNWEAYSFRGECFLKLQQYPAAFDDFNKVIELEGTDANQYNDRGRAFQLQEQYQEAICDYEKAIDLEPDHPYVWAHLAEVYLQLGELENRTS